MAVLDVDLARPIQGFSSAQEAIAAAQGGRLLKDHLASQPVIVKSRFSETELQLWLTRDECVQIRMETNSDLHCSIGAENKTIKSKLPHMLRLRRTRWTDVELWDRNKIPSLLIGCRLTGLFMSPPLLFMYTDRNPIILFVPLVAVKSGQHLLHWGFSE